MTVVHCKKNEYDVYIGRPPKYDHPFGVLLYHFGLGSVDSPARMGGHTARTDGFIHELKGKRLGCWRAPRSCHGDILSRLVNESNLDVFL